MRRDFSLYNGCMKINIKGTGIELTPEIRTYVEKKLGVVGKYMDANDSLVAQVEVGKNSQHHKTGAVFRAEAHLIGGGVDLYAVSEQADLYAAIDTLKDELAHKLNHLKGKKQTLAKRGGQMVKNMMRNWNPFNRGQ
jgi:putative sigma-54 modulation protein